MSAAPTTRPSLLPSSPSNAPPSQSNVTLRQRVKSPRRYLRDHLLDALTASGLPGKRIFHVHTLVSTPRRYADLFPYATGSRPKVWAQDILVLVSEQQLSSTPAASSSSAPTHASTSNDPTQSTSDQGQPNSYVNVQAQEGSNSMPPRVFVAAIEAALFTVPSTASQILYISKVDSTGQGIRPSPVRILVCAFLSFFLSPTTRPAFHVPSEAPVHRIQVHSNAVGDGKKGGKEKRVKDIKGGNNEEGEVQIQQIWLHVFARAQGQYLFPNSAQHKGKSPLSDVKLCAWWKGVVGDVAGRLSTSSCSGKANEGGIDKARLFYVLPGLEELEARQAMGELSSTAQVKLPTVPWTYGHPYSQPDIPLPYLPPSSYTTSSSASVIPPTHDDDPFLTPTATPSPVTASHEIHQTVETKRRLHRNLGMLIPSFDDDPKSRFIDEIAYTTKVDGVRSPPRKRARTETSGSSSGKPISTVGSGSSGSAPGAPLTSTNNTSESKDGADTADGDAESPCEGEKGSKEKEERGASGELGEVSADDFWERMSFRQECIAGAVTGFFVGAFSCSRAHVANESASSAGPTPIPTTSALVSSTAPYDGLVSHQLNKRIVSSLLTGHDFADEEKARQSTMILEGAIRGLCVGLGVHAGHGRGQKEGRVRADGEVKAGNGGRGDAVSGHTEGGAEEKVEGQEQGEQGDEGIDGEKHPPHSDFDFYREYVYGSIALDNAATPKQGAADSSESGVAGGEERKVTVLTVRKKKKPKA